MQSYELRIKDLLATHYLYVYEQKDYEVSRGLPLRLAVFSSGPLSVRDFVEQFVLRGLGDFDSLYGRVERFSPEQMKGWEPDAFWNRFVSDWPDGVGDKARSMGKLLELRVVGPSGVLLDCYTVVSRRKRKDVR